MAAGQKLLWVLAAIAGAGAVFVLRTPDDAPVQSGRAAAEIARYPVAEVGPVPSPDPGRAKDLTPTGLPRPGQGASSPLLESAPLDPGETSDELFLSPEASAAVTGSSAPGAETIEVGAFLDPEGYLIEDDKAPVLVGDYLDPDSTSSGD